MLHTISKEFSFDASHRLVGLAPGHKCMRMHGHSYRVRVVLGSNFLNKQGFVEDYADLGFFKEWIDENIDHRHLSGLDERVDEHEVQIGLYGKPVQTSAENLANYFYSILIAWADKKTRIQVVRVGVSETQKTWAWYQK